MRRYGGSQKNSATNVGLKSVCPKSSTSLRSEFTATTLRRQRSSLHLNDDVCIAQSMFHIAVHTPYGVPRCRHLSGVGPIVCRRPINIDRWVTTNLRLVLSYVHGARALTQLTIDSFAPLDQSLPHVGGALESGSTMCAVNLVFETTDCPGTNVSSGRTAEDGA